MVGKKAKVIMGAAAAAAAIATAVVVAKKMHEKGYDKKAVKMLHNFSGKLKKEAIALEKKFSEEFKKQKKKKGQKA